MPRTRIAGSSRAPLKVELDQRLARTADVTIKDRRQLINGELERMGITAFDLLSWEGMLAILDATKDAMPWGMVGPYQTEVHRTLAQAAQRRAAELDAQPTTLKGGGDYHRKLLQQFIRT